ncbi:hypothetical protein Clacol_005369 [Clathrus columnatus]|uniref:Uncharacterized protein n=1 Tax=Clathrus columnatus TaxID=1419009 RepID=A0AAV5ADD5_9AGAM|nr:hypothetical protein Clacol_005369 [Clathrus columnatus]
MRFSIVTYLAAGIATLCSSVVADVVFSLNNVNVTGSDLVNFSSAGQSFVQETSCGQSCDSISTQFQNCATDQQCTCSNTTASLLLDCEQCLFNALIEQNVKTPDSKVGSQPVLTAYTTGCGTALKTTFETLSLQLPANWDGPESLKISIGVTVVAVAASATIGFGGFYILWNLK